MIDCTNIFSWFVYTIQNSHPTYKNYPAYHTIYDNYRYYKRFIDPDMRYHSAITESLLRQSMRLGDDLLLPFNLTMYATSLEADCHSLEATYGEQLTNNSISLSKKKEFYRWKIINRKNHFDKVQVEL